MKKKTDARQDKGLKVHYVNELIKEIFVHIFFSLSPFFVGLLQTNVYCIHG